MKICPKCNKSFPDGVKLCPFDRIALIGENAAAAAAADSGRPGAAKSARIDMPAAGEIAALSIMQDGPNRLLFETQAFYHAPIQGLMVFGGGVLFMVFASLTGLGPKGGSAAPSMENETAVMLTVAGILALAAGIALQNIFRHYTVFDVRSGAILRQARAFGKTLWEGQLTRVDQLVALGTTTRAAGISAENLKMIIIGNFSKSDNRKLPYDVSLVMLGKDSKTHEITAFRNGTRQASLAAGRADLVSRLLNLPCHICNEGEMLEVVRKPGKPLNFQAVSHSAVAKRSENVANKVLVWVFLLIVLIGGWFLLMAWSGVWR
ncbi:MAG: hypothetical protein CVV41_08200 [Candidatus Riflebacteria bacterium HGW-Riflebacteria-1]|jgi:hypothetical protein|nr:MAG: hypothetical protein CVV41_08200 [Candidatus Riflebacteria bacterium HGW-Riflebacteria-1]